MKDGFFSVGDLARRDRDGRFFIEGRKRDMIISGGVNVYPAEVEAVLEEHPDVAEVAVVGVDDPEWGERVRAFVVKRAGQLRSTRARSRSGAASASPGPKVPRDFVFLDALAAQPDGQGAEARASRPRRPSRHRLTRSRRDRSERGAASATPRSVKALSAAGA